MRREWHKYIVFSAVSALMLMSCNDNEITEGVSRGQDSNVISLSGEIDQVAVMDNQLSLYDYPSCWHIRW